MNSRDAQKLYSGFLEGELSADEEDELRSFFARSPEAAADYRAFEATVDLLRSLPKEEASDDMTGVIMARVRRSRALGDRAGVATQRSRRRARQLLPFAAMLVLGFVSAFVWLNASGRFSSGDVAGEGTSVQQPALVAGTEVVPEGHALSESFQQNRFDRPLRQVDSGNESPSIVF